MKTLLIGMITYGIIAAGFSHPARAVHKTERSYGSLEAQKLDIYKPRLVKADTPVIIYVHGGGWHIGSKNNVGHKAEAFTKEGYVFVSVEYPLLPDSTVELQAESIAQAVAFVKDKSTSKAPLYLMGHSAGGHLSALVATNPAYLSLFDLTPDVISAVIHVDGAALNLPNKITKKRSAKKDDMYDKTFGTNEQRWEELSPYHNLEEHSETPPFLLLTADQHRKAISDAAMFAELLKRKNVYHQNVMINDRNHASINKKFGESSDKAFQVTIDFIRQLD
ncbi:MAG: alpha/beta hydrolase [Alphaproteobacteria bacterium]|nr:alpha/beta hydrolase [Alphaproteobacteria bacterium]